MPRIEVTLSKLHLKDEILFNLLVPVCKNIDRMCIDFIKAEVKSGNLGAGFTAVPYKELVVHSRLGFSIIGNIGTYPTENASSLKIDYKYKGESQSLENIYNEFRHTAGMKTRLNSDLGTILSYLTEEETFSLFPPSFMSDKRRVTQTPLALEMKNRFQSTLDLIPMLMLEAIIGA